ncbi:MAG: hypothetical protein ING75_13815 [Rhodocyclaceae bacterium]|nr:hypothetical protein [Rhodocyclaceae bacterium]
MSVETSTRSCQPCTACCDGWVRINVFDQPVLPGRPCPHSVGPVAKHGGGGCKIYAERPIDPCVNFSCGWVRESSHLPFWMKPNDAKVIVLPAWTTWRTFPVDLALPVGPLIPHKALKWLQQYSKEQFRPLIYSEQEIDRSGHYTGEQRVLGFGPPTFQQEMLDLVRDRRLG